MEMTIGKRTAQIQLLSKEKDFVRISVDDRIYEINVVVTDNGICSLIHDGRSFNMELSSSDNGRSYTVRQGFNSYEVEIVDAQEKYIRSRRKEDVRQEDTIVAPMPGKIVKILVNPGDQVKEGDTLVVFEAMKMQNIITATHRGRISRLCVKTGQIVGKDEILAEIKL